jgi:ATP-dependent Clp protease adaptor protein ClpS
MPLVQLSSFFRVSSFVVHPPSSVLSTPSSIPYYFSSALRHPPNRVIIAAMEPQPAPEIDPDQEEQQQTAFEPLYRVTIHNDDVTPMDFVVQILTGIFQLLLPDAVNVMYTAHYLGTAYVASLPKSEAQNRINKAHFAAGLEGYPLHFSMEPE